METQQESTQQQQQVTRVRPDVSYHHFNHSEIGRMLCTISVRRVVGNKDPLPFPITNPGVGEAMFVAGLSFCSADDEPSRAVGRKVSLNRIDSFLQRKAPRQGDRLVALFSNEDAMVTWLKFLRQKEENVKELFEALQERFQFNPHSWIA